MPSSNPDKLLERLPHGAAMRLIDKVVSVDETSAETQTYINDERVRLFGSGNRINSYLGIELIAQSAALPIIYNSEEGKQHGGMIVQVKAFQSCGHVAANCSTLTTCCNVELLLDGKLASVTGKVLDEQNLICEAVITLVIQEEVR